jgi:hypothetical protein
MGTRVTYEQPVPVPVHTHTHDPWWVTPTRADLYQQL